MAFNLITRVCVRAGVRSCVAVFFLLDVCVRACVCCGRFVSCYGDAPFVFASHVPKEPEENNILYTKLPRFMIKLNF